MRCPEQGGPNSLLKFCYYLGIQATTALAETTAIADFRGLIFFPLYTSFTVLDSFLSCYQSHLTLVQLLMHGITCCDGGGIGGCDIENRGGGGIRG